MTGLSLQESLAESPTPVFVAPSPAEKFHPADFGLSNKSKLAKTT
jgi:hypothetical protein